MVFKYGKDRLTAGLALQILRGQITAQIDPDTKVKIEACHQEVLAIASQDDAVYGINTGFGPLCNTRISKENTTQLQRKLLLSHSVGLGDPIHPDIAKLMLILKVHALSKAFSGISILVLERIQWFIEHDIIPVVPEQGSVGASGDLAPLSHLFLPLIGEGEVYMDGKRMDTAIALKQMQVEALDLHPKAGLALINGTQFITAHAVFIIESLHNCLAHADIIGAMMIEGLQGSKMPFQAKLHETRPYRGNIHVAARINHLLTDSEIIDSHKFCTKVQDPYSLRCMPQVHGSSRHAWLHLKETLEVELNSVTDNPIIFSRELSISGGNFHGQPMALPIDYACLAASELGNISDRRSYLSLEGKTDGVPKLLMAETGLNSGFMIIQYTGAAIASENKSLCYPASADSIPTSLGQEDHVSMGSISARKCLQVIKNLEKILAVELMCAAQAFDFQKPKKSSSSLDAIHQKIRENIEFATEDRIFSKDLEKAITLIQSKDLVEISKEFQIDEASLMDELFETF